MKTDLKKLRWANTTRKKWTTSLFRRIIQGAGRASTTVEEGSEAQTTISAIYTNRSKQKDRR